MPPVLRAHTHPATRQGDASLLELAHEAYATATAVIKERLWDAKGGYFHAWWDAVLGSPGNVMADCL